MLPNGLVVTDQKFDIQAIRTLQEGKILTVYSETLIGDPRTRVGMCFFVNEWERSNFRIVKEMVEHIKREVRHRVIDAEASLKRNPRPVARKYSNIS